MIRKLLLTSGVLVLWALDSSSAPIYAYADTVEDLKYPERCSICGRLPYNGKMCPYHWVEPGLSGTIFVKDIEINSYTPNNEKRRFHEDYVRTYKPEVSSGRILPQFGRYINLSGAVTSRYGFLRPINERLADYNHKCLTKTTTALMSAQEAMQWFKRNVKYRQLENGQYEKMVKRLGAWTRRLYAECVRYGTLDDAMPLFVKCFSSFNELYKPAAINEYNSGRSWGELRRDKTKALKWFYNNTTTIELALEDILDILDDRIANEYVGWRNDSVLPSDKKKDDKFVRDFKADKLANIKHTANAGRREPRKQKKDEYYDVQAQFESPRKIPIPNRNENGDVFSSENERQFYQGRVISNNILNEESHAMKQALNAGDRRAYNKHKSMLKLRMKILQEYENVKDRAERNGESWPSEYRGGDGKIFDNDGTTRDVYQY